MPIKTYGGGTDQTIITILGGCLMRFNCGRKGESTKIQIVEDRVN